jgi:DNA-binding CsgD family transcriptional regulator
MNLNLVSQGDYALLLDSIRELHTFRDQDALRAWLLDTALPKLVPSDWLSYNEVDLSNPEKTLSVLKPESNDFFQNLFPRFQQVAHQHPLIVRQMQSVDFPVHKISDFLSQESYHQLELYQDVYKPMGVEYQIAATIRLDPHHVTAFALSRRHTDYTERDRKILEMLRPHLVVAFNNIALTKTHLQLLDGAELALRELSSATLIVDAQHKVIYHTGAGLQWIGGTSPGILPSGISDWLKKHPVNGHCETFHTTSDSSEVCIRAVPTDSPDRRLLVLTRKNLSLPGSTTPTDFGLSKRQLEVAHWVREGKSNAEIAVILGISPRTVQKHIEHIFEKMGVETRVAIATRLHN